MQVSIWMLVITVLAAVAAYFAGSRVNKKDSGLIVKQSEELAAKMIDDARREAGTITKEADLKARAEIIEAYPPANKFSCDARPSQADAAAIIEPDPGPEPEAAGL